jgi:preprotein translocase subunit SecB
MTGKLSDDDTAAIRFLIEHSELRSIEHYEMSARRYDAPPADDAPDNGQVNIVVQQRSDADSFGVRLNAKIVIPLGEVEVSVAGEYALLNPAALTPRSLQLFANEVAVMTVFPYLREAVASITGRVFQQQLHLPMISRGQIVVDVNE